MRDPILKDVRVRHAIGYAIDRQAIVDYLRRGLATPAVGMLSPTNWAFEPDVFDFDYDPDTREACSTRPAIRDPDGDGPRPRLSLSLKVSSTEFNRLQSAVIQQNLRDVGIDARRRDRTSSPRCMPTSSRATFRCTRCSGPAARRPTPTS